MRRGASGAPPFNSYRDTIGIDRANDENLTKGSARSAVAAAPRQRGVCRRPASVLERRARQAGDRQLRREGDEGRLAGLCPARRADRHLRQRRHAVVRAAAARSALLCARPREGAGAAASRVDDQGTVRLAAQGRSASRARRRRPRGAGAHDGHACRHDRGGIRADREGLDRHRETSEDRQAPYRDGLSADARSAGLSARQRLQELHRLRRRHRVHAPVGGENLRHTAGAGRRQQRQDPDSSCATARPCCSACPS